jgi:hypothetical protein
MHAMENPQRGRFQFSMRTMILVTATMALGFVPIAWVGRERRQMLQAQDAILRAREVALQSVIQEEERRQSAVDASLSAAKVAELQRENASLRDQVESLRRQVQRLEERTKPRGDSRR